MNTLSSFGLMLAFFGVFSCSTKSSASPLLLPSGVSPEVATVSELTTSQLAALSTTLDAMHTEQIQLSALDTGITAKQIEFYTVQMHLRKGGSDSATDQELAGVENELTSLRSHRDEIIDTIRQEVLDYIETTRGTAAADDVEAMFANERREVPPYFKVLTMSEPEWNLLEQALQHRSRLAITGGDLSSQHANAITAAESHPRVVLAKQRLDANLEAATDMLDALLDQP